MNMSASAQKCAPTKGLAPSPQTRTQFRAPAFLFTSRAGHRRIRPPDMDCPTFVSLQRSAINSSCCDPNSIFAVLLSLLGLV
jgi:hypothetical protein